MNKQMTTQIHAACTNTPSLSTSPADQPPRGLALINPPHLLHLTHFSLLSSQQFALPGLTQSICIGRRWMNTGGC